MNRRNFITAALAAAAMPLIPSRLFGRMFGSPATSATELSGYGHLRGQSENMAKITDPVRRKLNEIVWSVTNGNLIKNSGGYEWYSEYRVNGETFEYFFPRANLGLRLLAHGDDGYTPKVGKEGYRVAQALCFPKDGSSPVLGIKTYEVTRAWVNLHSEEVERLLTLLLSASK